MFLTNCRNDLVTFRVIGVMALLAVAVASADAQTCPPEVVISEPIDTGLAIRETVIQASLVNPCHVMVATNGGQVAWAVDGGIGGRNSFTAVGSAPRSDSSIHVSPCSSEFWITSIRTFPREVHTQHAVYIAEENRIDIGPGEIVHEDSGFSFNKSTTLVAPSRVEPGCLTVSIGTSGADPDDPLNNGATFERRRDGGWTDSPGFAIEGGADGVPRMTYNAENYLLYAWMPNAGDVVQVASSGDDGDTWSEPVNAVEDADGRINRFNTRAVPGDFLVLNMIGIDADRRVNGTSGEPCNDRGYVVYAQLQEDEQNLDVMLLRGTGLGNGQYDWEPPITVSNESGWGCEHALDQFFPAIAVDARGWLHALNYQTCDDPNVPNSEPAILDVIYALSTDQGQTWQRCRINPVSIDTTGGTGQRNPGDYIGISASGPFIYPVYFGHEPGAEPNDPLRAVIHRIRVVDPEFGPDLDSDGDVDISDFSSFVGCFGQALPLSCLCEAADWNAGGKVTIADFATFTAAYTGSQSGCALRPPCEP